MNDQQIDDRRHKFLAWFRDESGLLPSGITSGLAHAMSIDPRVPMDFPAKMKKKLAGKSLHPLYWEAAFQREMAKLPDPKPEPKPVPTAQAVRAWLQQPRTREQLTHALSRCPHDHEARPDLEKAYAEVR